MKRKLQYLLFYQILAIVFFSCASIGPPSGGPPDIYPPYLLEKNISPLIKTGISKNQRIILPFSERILASSAINALRIEPSMDISVRISNNVIYVKPKEVWPNQFKLFISRNLSDYNNNTLVDPIELNYTLLDTLFLNYIYGNILNADSTKIYELALLDSNLNILSKTESNLNGKFKFSIQDIDTNHIILALENKISDNFVNDIRTREYGLSNRSINEIYNPIYISEPIYRAKINSINLINSNFGEIILSTGSKKTLLLNNDFMKDLLRNNNHYIYRDYNFIDSINIDMTMSNKIEEYNIKDTFFLRDTINDTLSVSIENHIISNDSLLVKFSEPVIIDDNLNPFYFLDIDSTEIMLNYDYINPDLVYVGNNNANDKIHIRCDAIKDLSNNYLCDDAMILDYSQKNNDEKVAHFGEISGSISYDGNHSIIIEALNLDSNDSFKLKVNNSGDFIFDQLLPGNYKIWAYENLNSITDYYFSGTLEPLKRSAKFIIYNKILYVRANWSNTISLELK